MVLFSGRLVDRLRNRQSHLGQLSPGQGALTFQGVHPRHLQQEERAGKLELTSFKKSLGLPQAPGQFVNVPFSLPELTCFLSDLRQHSLA